MKKKILAIIATLVMALALAVPAFAASGITSAEQALRNEFKAGVNGIKPPAQWVAKAENALKTYDLTSAQIATFRNAMQEAKAEVAESGATSLKEIRKLDNYTSIRDDIIEACAEAGFTVSINDSTAGTQVIGPDGKVVSSVTGSNTGKNGAPSNVKQTGFDMTATVVTVLAFVGVLSAGAVVISKKELLAD